MSCKCKGRVGPPPIYSAIFFNIYLYVAISFFIFYFLYKHIKNKHTILNSYKKTIQELFNKLDKTKHLCIVYSVYTFSTCHCRHLSRSVTYWNYIYNLLLLFTYYIIMIYKKPHIKSSWIKWWKCYRPSKRISDHQITKKKRFFVINNWHLTWVEWTSSMCMYSRIN